MSRYAKPTPAASAAHTLTSNRVTPAAVEDPIDDGASAPKLKAIATAAIASAQCKKSPRGNCSSPIIVRVRIMLGDDLM